MHQGECNRLVVEMIAGLVSGSSFLLTNLRLQLAALIWRMCNSLEGVKASSGAAGGKKKPNPAEDLQRKSNIFLGKCFHRNTPASSAQVCKHEAEHKNTALN